MESLFGPPIDLTSLPAFARVETGPRRAVFCGRVSTKDQQNPSSSIPRQVALASQRLEDGEEFTGHFWDVESGMLPPESRGLGPQEMYDALRVPTPRDGGLQDLLDRAELLGVTHVLAERSDRVARAMLTSLTVEHELQKIGVEVVYANEPIGGTESGRLRTRRYSQVEAELYRTVMLEMSMGGQVQHAVNGWNHGVPPYPYIAVVDEDAPPAARGRFGEARPKKKLAPHPDERRFDASAKLCRLRREEHLKAADIIAILSAAPDRYPIDGRWTHNRVEGLIANPKLTGYQVYNRKATRTGKPGSSRWNPISQWVWSPRPVHEAVVTLEEWKAALEITAGLRAGAAAGPLMRIQSTASRKGLAFSVVEETGNYTRYRIGGQLIVLPDPVPDAVARQLIEDLENAP
ncbi:recombinase family protein [Streptomyces rubiginosohelvolus]|uniref:recombinase family protein n=1 Tax=Streptomyces rubiginosohelvolus TaxID=67362 RepID=UPI003660A627